MMSGRTVEQFRSKGINQRLSRQLIRDFPGVTNVVFDGGITEALQKRLSRAQSLCSWVRSCHVGFVSVITL